MTDDVLTTAFFFVSLHRVCDISWCQTGRGGALGPMPLSAPDQNILRKALLKIDGLTEQQRSSISSALHCLPALSLLSSRIQAQKRSAKMRKLLSQAPTPLTTGQKKVETVRRQPADRFEDSTPGFSRGSGSGKRTKLVPGFKTPTAPTLKKPGRDASTKVKKLHEWYVTLYDMVPPPDKSAQSESEESHTHHAI